MENLKPLIIDSLELLFIGMGSVFVILICLIFLITWTSKLLSGYQDTAPKASRRSLATNSHPHEDGELIAVISAAIHSYKKNL